MAWIPYEVGLPRKLEVRHIARATGLSRYDVAGRLLEFWGWASGETSDGLLRGMGISDLVDLVGFEASFFEAMIQAGWLKARQGGLFIPNAEEWITKGAKARLQKNRRQSRWRDADVDAPVDAPVDDAPSTKASTTVHNITEQNISPTEREGKDSSSDPPEARVLAEQLRQAIRAHKPDAKVPEHLGAWARTFRLMLTHDARAPDRIAAVIEWATSDPFWRSNILSADKLRAKFDQLEIRMQEATSNGRRGTGPDRRTATPDREAGSVGRDRYADAEARQARFVASDADPTPPPRAE